MEANSINKEVYDEALRLLLSSDPEENIDLLLEEIVKFEEEHKNDNIYGKYGFEWYHVHADPRTLNTLVTRRILDIKFKTNKSTYYKLRDIEAVKKAIEDYKNTISSIENEDTKIPDNLFDIIIGHQDKKEIILRALKSEHPVHCLLYGSIASAKTLILEELAKLPYSTGIILGSSLTKAGIYDVLFNEKPRYLIIDELDKIEDSDNLSALLSLMERGYISETKFRKRRSLRLKCWVFASANRIDKIPPELLSRFTLLKFRDYTPEEYKEVVKVVLSKREKVPEDLALYIAEKVLYELLSKDVRDSVKVSRLIKSKTKDEVDKVIELLKRQK
jgi:Holliday junction DNA helicase RuvB